MERGHSMRRNGHPERRSDSVLQCALSKAVHGALGVALLLAAAAVAAQPASIAPPPGSLGAATTKLGAPVPAAATLGPPEPALATQPTLSAPAPKLGAPDPIEQRWQSSFDAFAAADRARPPVPGGVLFVGSSSIRLWDGLETDFSALPVVTKRGFGGSTMSDCTAELQRLVLPYKPRLVIVYAGDNDLAAGRTPQQVLKSYTGFVEGVRKTLPQTRIAYISIKPSPLREKLMPLIRTTNELVARYTARAKNLDYIDIFTPMLGANGRPRPELFRADGLHPNVAGYALWRKVVSTHVQPPH